tara:strand:- start:585 stop:872 length:288 start_codon:yes stop_codon:yes gene_type:complete
MIGEGLFILAVSLSGDYTDMKYISNFPNCTIAMQHFKEHCSEYKAASCTLQKYTMLPPNHATVNAFSFNITEPQSCGFIGVDTRTFTKEDDEFTK